MKNETMHSGLANSSLMKDLARQTVGHTLSTVSAACGTTLLDSLLLAAPVVSVESEGAQGALTRLAEIFRAAYGYRVTEGRVTRYAPSAGARYPTEFVAVIQLDGGWRSLIYDFRKDCFYELAAPESAGASVAQYLSLTDDEVFVGAFSILWRTVQRYGFRGHRYCIVDAVCAISNVMALSGSSGTTYLGPSICVDIDSIIGFPSVCPLVSATKFSVNSSRSANVQITKPFSGISHQCFIEEMPAMSPVLRRVEAFHAKAAQESKLMANPEIIARASFNDDTVGEWILRRKSMRAGCANAIPVHIEKALRRYVSERLARRDELRLAVVWIKVNQNRQVDEFLSCDTNGQETQLQQSAFKTAKELSVQCFQGQEVIESSSLIALVGPRYISSVVNHGAYLVACHEVAALISDFYRVSVNLGLASTAIGGFSWEDLKGQVELPGFFPLMAHAFGYGEGAGTKDDTDWMYRTATGRKN